MANDLNQCNFTGRLGKDPESRVLPGGETVTNFSMAVGKSWKNKDGEKQERTTWVPVTTYGKLAEIVAKYARKGLQVRVTGEFQARKWQDKDGNDRYSTDIIASDFQMFGGKEDGGAQGGGQQRAPAPQAARPAQAPADSFDDDIPF